MGGKSALNFGLVWGSRRESEDWFLRVAGVVWIFGENSPLWQQQSEVAAASDNLLCADVCNKLTLNFLGYSKQNKEQQ